MERKHIIRKSLFAIATAVTLFSLVCCAGKKAVTFEELPAQLQTLISQCFPGETLSYAILEREGMGKKYDLVLSDGTTIEADADGQWIEIESGHGKDVPLDAIPQQLQSYLLAKHPGTGIRKIESRSRGYEIELSNGLEIKFDKDFVVKEYDH